MNLLHNTIVAQNPLEFHNYLFILTFKAGIYPSAEPWIREPPASRGKIIE